MSKFKEDMYKNSKESLSKSNFTTGGRSVFDIIKDFSKRCVTVGAIYLVGYFNISPAWLLGPLILSMIRDQWKLEKELKQHIAMAAALRSDKQFIIANIGQLPLWVYFPDVDRCEWINRILVHLWPNFTLYAMEYLKSSVESNINKTFAPYKKDAFKFQHVRLGLIPPRIGGVKVYEKNINRNEIVIDMNIWYAGDCDISFVLLGLSGGIKNFQICGLLRLVLKPLTTSMPLFRGIEIFFVHKPTIDFNLVGVIDLLDMPGLSGTLRQIIDDQIALMMVLPNKIPVILSDIVDSTESKFPDPEGVLRVNVVEAVDLVNKDLSVFGKGKSDPYVTVSFGTQTFVSSVIENSLNPKWDFWAEFIIDALYGDTFLITVMDRDVVLENSLLGNISVEVNRVKVSGVLDTWIQLEETKKGMVHLCAFYFHLTSNRDDFNTGSCALPFLSSSLLVVYIESAQNLVNPRSSEKPDTRVYLVVGNITQMSKIVLSTDSPVFEEDFKFLVNNPENDKLQVKFIDQKLKTKLGCWSFHLKELLDCDQMELMNQHCPLVDIPTESTVVLSMKLRILRNDITS